MRIVQLNPFFFPYAGGTERRILELGRRLARRHEVVVLTSQLPGTDPIETMQGIEVRRLPSTFRLGRWWNPPLVRTPGVRAGLRALRADVVDHHYRWARDYDRAFASVDGAGTAFTYNNSYGEGTGLLRWASLANDAWTARTVRGAQRIVCVSRFIRDDLAARGFPEGRLEVVPNGVDAERLRAEAGRGRVPDAVAGQRYVAAVGRLVGIKGFDLAIRSLASLPSDVHLVVCGQGPQGGRLARLARRRGLAERVHLLGWVPEAEKLRLVKEAVALVHPARFEAFGIAPLEALALGTPVVATRVGGLSEVVGDAGALVEPEAPEDLAAGVRPFRHPLVRSRVSARARRRADAYTWDAAAAAIERTYLALGDGRKTT